MLTGMEFVGVAISRCDRALCHGVNTIILDVLEHTEPVPVNSGAVARQVIPDSDFDIVTPASLNPGTRICSIEQFGFTILAAVRVYRTSIDVKHVFPCNAFREDVLVVCLNIVRRQPGVWVLGLQPAAAVILCGTELIIW
jgi:hypothetical protein